MDINKDALLTYLLTYWKFSSYQTEAGAKLAITPIFESHNIDLRLDPLL